MRKFSRKEPETEPLSLKEMFAGYCAMDTVSSALGVEHIPLTQSDKWLIAAKILDMNKLTITDTGLLFFKFRKRALSYEEYLQYLKDIAESKGFNFQDMIHKMERSGKPTLGPVKITK